MNIKHAHCPCSEQGASRLAAKAEDNGSLCSVVIPLEVVSLAVFSLATEPAGSFKTSANDAEHTQFS